MFGHPALHLLIRMKIRAGIRQQVRRLKRPAGWIFMILGLCLMVLWAGGLLFGNRFARAEPASPQLTAFWTRLVPRRVATWMSARMMGPPRSTVTPPPPPSTP